MRNPQNTTNCSIDPELTPLICCNPTKFIVNEASKRFEFIHRAAYQGCFVPVVQNREINCVPCNDNELPLPSGTPNSRGCIDEQILEGTVTTTCNNTGLLPDMTPERLVCVNVATLYNSQRRVFANSDNGLWFLQTEQCREVTRT